MTTYYGVWSGEGNEWWHIGQEIFHTASCGLAKAQAMVANSIWKSIVRGERMHWHWEARAIGEDGLPVTREQWQQITEEQKRIRSEAAPHKCAICGSIATNWVEMRDRKWYFCDRHEAWGQYVLSDHLRRRLEPLDPAGDPPRPESCHCASSTATYQWAAFRKRRNHERRRSYATPHPWRD